LGAFVCVEVSLSQWSERSNTGSGLLGHGGALLKWVKYPKHIPLLLVLHIRHFSGVLFKGLSVFFLSLLSSHGGGNRTLITGRCFKFCWEQVTTSLLIGSQCRVFGLECH
jgi:hypothetical protein